MLNKYLNYASTILRILLCKICLCFIYFYYCYKVLLLIYSWMSSWQPRLSMLSSFCVRHKCTEVWPSETSRAKDTLHLRSTADHDAANSVGESVGEQTRDVIIHDLHLAALVLAHLKQADLVLLRVLQEKTQWMHCESIQTMVPQLWEHLHTILTGLKESR